jgi:hypothetical protein
MCVAGMFLQRRTNGASSQAAVGAGEAVQLEHTLRPQMRQCDRNPKYDR